MIRLEIKKLQKDTNREQVKISALSSGKIDKYEYLKGEEILPPDQKVVIEQAKFTKLEKQIKSLEEHGKQLVGSNAHAKK